RLVRLEFVEGWADRAARARGFERVAERARRLRGLGKHRAPEVLGGCREGQGQRERQPCRSEFPHATCTASAGSRQPLCPYARSFSTRSSGCTEPSAAIARLVIR